MRESAGFIYRDEGSKFAKFLFKSMNGLDAFNLQNDYLIGEACLGVC